MPKSLEAPAVPADFVRARDRLDPVGAQRRRADAELVRMNASVAELAYNGAAQELEF
jgi:hypothetical protein